MFKVNDYVIYKRDVCIILEEKLISNYEYFVLQSTIDDSLKINIPKNMSSKLLRHLNTLNISLHFDKHHLAIIQHDLL